MTGIRVSFAGAGGSGSGTIKKISSADGSIAVVDPTGPT